MGAPREAPSSGRHAWPHRRRAPEPPSRPSAQPPSGRRPRGTLKSSLWRRGGVSFFTTPCYWEIARLPCISSGGRGGGLSAQLGHRRRGDPGKEALIHANRSPGGAGRVLGEPLKQSQSGSSERRQGREGARSSNGQRKEEGGKAPQAGLDRCAAWLLSSARPASASTRAEVPVARRIDGACEGRSGDAGSATGPSETASGEETAARLKIASVKEAGRGRQELAPGQQAESWVPPGESGARAALPSASLRHRHPIETKGSVGNRTDPSDAKRLLCEAGR